MTNFDPTKSFKDPNEWSQLAFKETTENNIQWFVGGGIVLALGASALVSPFTGAIVGGWTIYLAVKKAGAVQANQRAIREHGCIAHVLEGENLKNFKRQVGEQEVIKQISFAKEQGYQLSFDAEDLYEDVLEKSTSPLLLQPASVDSLPRTKEELRDRLKGECKPLLDLVKSHPIRAVGVQRSGKTTAVKIVALLRMIFLPDHRIVASTPHHEQKNPFPSIFKVVGFKADGGRDLEATRKEWEALQNGVDACMIGNVTNIWDEFGSLDQAVDEKLIGKLLKSALRETKKFEYYPIFILHGETKAFMPGCDGMVTLFKESTVRVETIGEKIEGGDGLDDIRPTGKFKVTWIDGTTEEARIPDWLTEKYLLSFLADQIPQTLETAPQDSQSPIDETALMLADLQASPYTTLEDFVSKGYGINEPEDIKRATEAIALFLNQQNNAELLEKFGLKKPEA